LTDRPPGASPKWTARNRYEGQRYVTGLLPPSREKLRFPAVNDCHLLLLAKDCQWFLLVNDCHLLLLARDCYLRGKPRRKRTNR